MRLDLCRTRGGGPNADLARGMGRPVMQQGPTLGMRYCRMGTSNMMGTGKITPASTAVVSAPRSRSHRATAGRAARAQGSAGHTYQPGPGDAVHHAQERSLEEGDGGHPPAAPRSQPLLSVAGAMQPPRHKPRLAIPYMQKLGTQTRLQAGPVGGMLARALEGHGAQEAVALVPGLRLPLLGVGEQQQGPVPELAARQGGKGHVRKVACTHSGASAAAWPGPVHSCGWLHGARHRLTAPAKRTHFLGGHARRSTALGQTSVSEVAHPRGPRRG